MLIIAQFTISLSLMHYTTWRKASLPRSLQNIQTMFNEDISRSMRYNLHRAYALLLRDTMATEKSLH